MFLRYDYENVECAPAKKMMADLQTGVEQATLIGKSFESGGNTFKVVTNDNFGYTDPIDHSITKNQVSQMYLCKLSMMKIIISRCSLK